MELVLINQTFVMDRVNVNPVQETMDNVHASLYGLAQLVKIVYPTNMTLLNNANIVFPSLRIILNVTSVQIQTKSLPTVKLVLLVVRITQLVINVLKDILITVARVHLVVVMLQEVHLPHVMGLVSVHAKQDFLERNVLNVKQTTIVIQMAYVLHVTVTQKEQLETM
jgi:hypothetical protein